MSPGRLKLLLISAIILVLVGWFFVFQGKNALAAIGINKQINFQGKVVNTDGTNVSNASYSFIFCLYTASNPITPCTVGSDNDAIWRESKNITVTDGIFQTALGDAVTFPSSVDFNTDNIYLGVNFNSNGQMMPLIRFTASPYAFNADNLDGKDWTTPGVIGSVTPNSGLFTTVGVLETGSTPTYKTIFQGGDQSADIIYTLPSVLNNGILKNISGTLSWDAANYLINPMSTLGDIIYGGASGAPNRLSGSAGFLTSTGSAAPTWTSKTTDYFSQYALLDGRSGGQTLIGGTAANDDLIIQGNSASSGNIGTNTAIQFNVGNFGATTAFSILQDGTLNFHNSPTQGIRIENADASVLAPSCDGTSLGRMYYDTSAGSAFVCIESAPGVYGWFDYTTTSVQSNKVVTVGTGGDFTSISAGAGYLNALGGGIILLTPENHNVTSTVDLENINIVGANTGDTRINITGAGKLRVKETQFKSMTINVDAGITANSGIDAKYSATTTSSIIFEWVDFIINGTKVLINSSDAVAPIIKTRFISTSTTSGTQKIFLPKATANLNAGSNHFVESQGGNGALDMEDWSVKIAGSSNVKTTGTIETIPDSTVFVYPGMNIQGAINSLPSGGVITLLPGVHNISSTLLINKDNIEIQGYGDASILRAAGFVGGTNTTAAIQVGTADGATPNNNVVLSNFRLEVSSIGGSDIHGVRVAGGSDNQILDLSIVKTSGASGTGAGGRMGIHMIDGTTQKLVRPIIKGCLISGTSSVVAYFTDGIHVTGGATYGAGSGIFTNGQGVDGALVDGNYVDYVRETVAVFAGVNNSSMYNNRFSRMGAGAAGGLGIFLGNSSNVNMTANVVATSLSANSTGINIESLNSGSMKQITDSVFTTNTVDGLANGGTGFAIGVNIGSVANTTFSRNIFSNNVINGSAAGTTTAINIAGIANDNNIVNNIINGGTNTWTTGVRISAAASRTNIGKTAFIAVTTNIEDAGVGTQFDIAQHNAVINPTVADDNTRGYAVGAIWVNTATSSAYIATSVAAGAATWEQIDAIGGGSSDLDTAYTSDADKVMAVNNVSGLEFASTSTGNISFDLQSTGDFILQDNNVTFLTINDAGGFDYILDATDNPAFTINNLGTNSFIINDQAGDATPFTIDQNGNVSAGGNLSFSGINPTISSLALNSTLSIDANGSGIITLGGTSTGNLIFGGGSASTGCTLNNATGNFTCAGDITPTEISGQQGWLTRTGTTLAPSNAGDAITTSGNISTTGAGTITSAGLITGSAGASIGPSQSYTGTGSVTLSSADASGLTINSGTTGTISIGDDSSAEIINIGTGTAAKTLVIGSTSTTSMTTIQSGTSGISLQSNGTGAGNVQIGDGGAASATPDMLVLDVGSVEPTGTNGATYYSTALNKFRCYENNAWKDCITSTSDTAVFTDTTSVPWTDTDTTELFNDATKPNITTDFVTSTVLVHVQIYGQTSNTNNDAFLAARIVKTTNGTNPSCASATNVGVPMIGGFTTSNAHPWQVVGTFIDSPATAGNIRYTVCTSTDSTGTATDTPEQVIVELVELGADIAENYFTQDDSIESGDVVAIDAAISAGIKKSIGVYDQNVIGVVSTNPGIILDDAIGMGQGRAVAVALAGRIPVKVSTENGRVKAGDYLVASSVPGVAMKATKSGIVIGQALQDFSYANDVIGLVLTFVKNGNYNGTHLVDGEDKTLTGVTLLQKLMNDKVQYGETIPISNISTDRLAAGLEVVTPQIFADSIIAKTIKAEHIEGLEFIETGIQNAQEIAEDNIIGVKSLGQKIADIQNTIKSLSNKAGNLIVNSLVEFRGQTIFKSIVEFIEKVIFRNDVEFIGHVMFNQDAAGYALIKDEQDMVKVTFEKEYAIVPVVTASLSLQQIEDLEERRASEELLLLSDVKFIITNVTTKGFEIRINQPAVANIPFSWQAMAIKDAKIFMNQDKKGKENSADSEEILPDIYLPDETIPAATLPEEDSSEVTPASISDQSNVSIDAPDTTISDVTLSAEAIIPSENNIN